MSNKKQSPLSFLIALILMLTLGAVIYYCTSDEDSDTQALTANSHDVEDGEHINDSDTNDENASADNEETGAGQPGVLPYSTDIAEAIVMDYGKRTIRTESDETLKFPDLMKNKKNCFIVISKKDYYLYVYEAQGKDTVMLARFDCAMGLKKGDKTMTGDSRTPHCDSPAQPFHVSEIKNSSDWSHDFGDGRGSILSYGDYFIRLRLAGHAHVPGNSSIGIHGSTNNEESVPGRASEGCVRLSDDNIVYLRHNFVTEGMKVIIKAENVDDYGFEVKAMQKQHISRKRHFDPSKTLTNEQIKQVPAKIGRSKSNATKGNTSADKTKNKTIEQLNAENGKGNNESAPISENKTLEQLQSDH